MVAEEQGRMDGGGRREEGGGRGRREEGGGRREEGGGRREGIDLTFFDSKNISLIKEIIISLTLSLFISLW